LHDYLLAALLGVVEGITEFLPVSSTAHLRIVEALAGIRLDDNYWKMFSVVIQLGAILCLPIYFGARIAGFLRTFPKGGRGDRTFLTHPIGLTALACLCTIIPSYLMRKIIGDNLENLAVMGWSLILGGAAMWLIDGIYGRGSTQTADAEVEQMRTGQAVAVGLLQNVAAVFPGTSRSMATISAGQLVGLSREAALEFSFLLSMPTMAAATGYDFLKALKSGALGAVGGDQWILLTIGFVTSFVVAYGVVAWFMHWVRERGFVPFAVYRIIAGALVLWWF
jgi:undecaprenyl-diphosphatase